MIFQRFMMMHGLGAPASIAKMMARRYEKIKNLSPETPEEEVLRQVYVWRIAVQTSFGGPKEYRELKSNPSFVEGIVHINSNLLAIIRLAVFQEIPEFFSPAAPADRLEILDGVLREVINREAPSWSEPAPPLTVVDSSYFFQTGLPPITLIAWHNGSHHNPFTGYGFKISAEDRDAYIDRNWKEVVLALPISAGFAMVNVNIDKTSFWEGNCREFIAKEIGIWMMSRQLAPWPNGEPPHFFAVPVGIATYRIETSRC